MRRVKTDRKVQTNPVSRCILGTLIFSSANLRPWFKCGRSSTRALWISVLSHWCWILIIPKYGSRKFSIWTQVEMIQGRYDLMISTRVVQINSVQCLIRTQFHIKLIDLKIVYWLLIPSALTHLAQNSHKNSPVLPFDPVVLPKLCMCEVLLLHRWRGRLISRKVVFRLGPQNFVQEVEDCNQKDNVDGTPRQLVDKPLPETHIQLIKAQVWSTM